MSEKKPGRRMFALACALGFAALLVTGMSGTVANAAPSVSPHVAAPEMGIRFFPNGDAGQCSGPTQQFEPSPNFTTPIRFDTDNRGGGCQFAFGIYDPDNALSGLSATYSWQATPGGDPNQCAGMRGTFALPITPFQSFGTQLLDDTDNRPGGCNLTFAVAGRSDIGLNVEFYADGDASQCINALPQGQFYTVVPGSPVTIGLDTDGRSGACLLALRVQHFGFITHHAAA